MLDAHKLFKYPQFNKPFTLAADITAERYSIANESDELQRQFKNTICKQTITNEEGVSRLLDKNSGLKC